MYKKHLLSKLTNVRNQGHYSLIPLYYIDLHKIGTLTSEICDATGKPLVATLSDRCHCQDKGNAEEITKNEKKRLGLKRVLQNPPFYSGNFNAKASFYRGNLYMLKTHTRRPMLERNNTFFLVI